MNFIEYLITEAPVQSQYQAAMARYGGGGEQKPAAKKPQSQYDIATARANKMKGAKPEQNPAAQPGGAEEPTAQKPGQEQVAPFKSIGDIYKMEPEAWEGLDDQQKAKGQEVIIKYFTTQAEKNPKVANLILMGVAA